jgi:hypothetical protein
MRSTRQPTRIGNRADGLVGYSYAVPSSDGTDRGAFLSALTAPSGLDTNPVPIFAAAADPPVMLWKVSPTRGHLKGFICDLTTGAPLEDAAVSIIGFPGRAARTDPTGFYGMVDLEPGVYEIVVERPGFLAQSAPVTIVPGQVTTLSVELPIDAGAAFFADVEVSPGSRAAIVRWTTATPSGAQIEYGPEAANPQRTPEIPGTANAHEMLLSGLLPSTRYEFRLLARRDGEQWRSLPYAFTTAGALLLDNPVAGYVGPWTTGTASTDKFATDYRFAGTVSGAPTATATFVPFVTTPGRYDVYVWYPQGSNRATNAPFIVASADGVVTNRIDQTIGGGQWRLVASGRILDRGTNHYVRLTNSTGQGGRVVMADAVRLVYAPNQDPPPPNTVPAWWAHHYFGAAVEPLLDHDSDGFSTYAEFVWGTAPTDPAAHLALSVAPAPVGAPSVAFRPFHPGRTYTLLSSDTLDQPDWTVRVELPPVPTGDGSGRFTDIAAKGLQRYYRVGVELLP